MSKYHLVHCVPHPRLHGLYGYREVIETVKWGLEQLGHQVSSAMNHIAPDATNIIFGAHMLPMEVIAQLADDTIVYNFEQMRGLEQHEIRPEMRQFAQRFRVWDYSSANSDAWAALEAKNVKVVPVGYAPVLTTIPKATEQDIDVLIYGAPGQDRVTAFHNLCWAGLTTMFVCGLYGAARNALIARSKIILNVNLYSHAQIFEIVRVSYLMANKKAVVATMHPQTFVDADVRNAVKLTTMEGLLNDCAYLIEHQEERVKLEEAGFSCITQPQRDIRAILKNALGT